MGIDLLVGAQIFTPAIGRVVLAAVRKQKKDDQSGQTEERAYAQVLHMMRKTFSFIAANRLEDIQHLTTSWIPHPPSTIITEVQVPESFYPEAARHICDNLSEDNLKRVGKEWWRFRLPGSVVRAEWVEEKSDYEGRIRRGGECRRIVFYVHGGAYFLGGIGHGSQIQRHARKLGGRVFAPRYRLAPQFPFPCALQDVLSAYLYLISIQDPSTIVLAGDSAGAGLVLSLLLILRDQCLPFPAGASLISPWVDLTHSFPSITIPTMKDYVPAHGFHVKPSVSWPPPTPDEMKILGLARYPGAEEDLEVVVDGETVLLKEQIQMYAPNDWIQIPLVSGILAASLGGLPPLQILSGSAELLHDEHIYLAHKAASPVSYPPSSSILARNSQTICDVTRYPPTKVQLLVFDDVAHAATILGNTNGAKLQFRAVAQFACWALSEAASDLPQASSKEHGGRDEIGKPGDPLPAFKDSMIRLRVCKTGALYPLAPASSLRACIFPRDEVGQPKGEALKLWFEFRRKADVKFRAEREKVWKQRIRESKIGYVRWPNEEVPPPSALAGRLVLGMEVGKERERGRFGKGFFGGLLGYAYTQGPDIRGGEVKVGKRRQTFSW